MRRSLQRHNPDHRSNWHGRQNHSHRKNRQAAEGISGTKRPARTLSPIRTDGPHRPSQGLGRLPSLSMGTGAIFGENRSRPQFSPWRPLWAHRTGGGTSGIVQRRMSRCKKEEGQRHVRTRVTGDERPIGCSPGPFAAPPSVGQLLLLDRCPLAKVSSTSLSSPEFWVRGFEKPFSGAILRCQRPV